MSPDASTELHDAAPPPAPTEPAPTETAVDVAVGRYPVGQCGSCQAPVIWAVTIRDRRMPVDAEPVNAGSGGGNVLLSGPAARPIAEVVSNPGRLFGKTVWRSHFVTCPFAAHHRKPRVRRSRS